MVNLTAFQLLTRVFKNKPFIYLVISTLPNMVNLTAFQLLTRVFKNKPFIYLVIIV